MPIRRLLPSRAAAATYDSTAAAAASHYACCRIVFAIAALMSRHADAAADIARRGFADTPRYF